MAETPLQADLSAEARSPIRTHDEEAKVTRLLRALDVTVIDLWKLGVDPRGRVQGAVEGAWVDGVQRGSGCVFYEEGR